MARWAPILLIAVLAGLLGTTLTACAASSTGEVSRSVTPANALTDFSTLAPPDTPNNWLVAPADFAGAAQPDEFAPVFDIPPGALAEAWRAAVESQPRAEILVTSDDGLRMEARQKSAVFGFVDRISVEVLPVDDGRATFAAYSTSLVGYWDIGANRGRLREWIDGVRQRAADSAPSRR